MTPAPGSGTRCLLAFLATVGNNPVKPIMRLAYGIAIALCLSFPVVGMAWQQDAAGAATSAGQAPTAPAAGQTAPAEEPPAEGKKPSANPASASAAPKHPKRKVPAPPPDGAPHKVVVREGGASEPTAQIIPGMTPQEAARRRQNAEQLLGVTDEQLKQMAERTLSAPQQQTAAQIRNYMDGARSALKEGDVRRASTLAEKAHLLAEDLAKH
jgi:hypothetical protein